ncbi:MAG: Holliday junction branch migration protein RuvA [Eubacteriales bacterium]|nr:Holliday junction branch migration protein RuvA [Eubacteriales bacterium]
MIAYLNGRLAGIYEDNLVVEVGHIGYNVRVPASVTAHLPAIGEEIKIYTYTSVREDAIALYGFLTRDDLEMYRQLITVSGIGPKGGLAVLSVMSADELRMAVVAQDAKAIARAPGVGAKTAQRIILELKDKISLEDTALLRESSAPALSAPGALGQARTEAVEALTALGYAASDALRAVKAVEQEDMDVEALLKAALKKMF